MSMTSRNMFAWAVKARLRPGPGSSGGISAKTRNKAVVRFKMFEFFIISSFLLLRFFMFTPPQKNCYNILEVIFMETILKADNKKSSPISAVPTLDDELLAKLAKQGTPVTVLEVDENGGLVIDKDRHPHLYDWVMNG